MPRRYYYNYGLLSELSRWVGSTVTIFTTSGGQSGDGFTGVLMGVNCRFVRLLVEIGPGPGCALGNACDTRGNWNDDNEDDNFGNISDEDEDDEFCGRRRRRRHHHHRNRTMGLGSIVDIPVDRIAAFVHNSVGANGGFFGGIY